MISLLKHPLSFHVFPVTLEKGWSLLNNLFYFLKFIWTNVQKYYSSVEQIFVKFNKYLNSLKITINRFLSIVNCEGGNPRTPWASAMQTWASRISIRITNLRHAERASATLNVPLLYRIVSLKLLVFTCSKHFFLYFFRNSGITSLSTIRSIHKLWLIVPN